MRNRKAVDNNSDNSEEQDDWVKVSTPTDELPSDTLTENKSKQAPLFDVDSNEIDGQGIKITAALQSMVERTDLTPADMQRGRNLLLQKRIAKETQDATRRQQESDTAEWNQVLNYIYYGSIILILMYLFFRYGPTLQKSGAPGRENPAMDQIKAQAVEELGQPLADIIGLRL